ncbi:MBL fold metallo-hydrolase [Gordonia rhizosphera]|uniref:Metallo-beta-lactamase domain-containing protein n=1 Tax=Gordonia rhizosphera NBRC 16068 TaxID=1108045 RepID=K6WHL5_9ACTN|nr:MBL fold metallo-hydrolase [Gordonia rhizosphera]GAB91652.1 hypothetical protein GORHZ_141_00270 [Gordonia rhizosphera NBRC 16068]
MTAGKVTHVAEDVFAVRLGRGPLASNVYLVGSGEDWVLVDTGWAGNHMAIREAAASVFGPTKPPAAILLTHIHPDHSGSAGELARDWQVPVFAHADEVPMAAGKYLPEYSMPLDRWIVDPILRLLPAGTRARIEAGNDITDVVQALPANGEVPGLPDWHVVPAPGHTPGHVAYLRRRDRVVICGDAVLTVDVNSVIGVLAGRERLCGPPWYTTWDRQTARESIAALAALHPRILAPGHGPARGVENAALQALARDG